MNQNFSILFSDLFSDFTATALTDNYNEVIIRRKNLIEAYPHPWVTNIPKEVGNIEMCKEIGQFQRAQLSATTTNFALYWGYNL